MADSKRSKVGSSVEKSENIQIHTDNKALRSSLLLFLLLVFLVCLPIWVPTYFFNADGPPHLQSAAMMIDLAAGGSTKYYVFNSAFVPNSIGHWLLAVMMVVVSPVVASKLMATITYAGFVMGVAWLRFACRGTDGLRLAVLIGGVLGLNWLWLVGFYNFLLGVIIFLAAVGFLYWWRGVLTLKRSLLFAVFFVAAYLGHLVSFALLGLAAGIFVLLAAGDGRFRSLFWLAVSVVPAGLLVFAYKLSISDGSQFIPMWTILEGPLSLASIGLHLRTTEPFLIISRRFIPFLAGESAFNYLASPIIWIGIAFSIILAATLSEWRKKGFRQYFPHIAVILVLLVLAFLAPDELGPGQASIIRPRLFLCAVVLFVPFYAVRTQVLLGRIAAVLLAALFAYQVAALWEYSAKVDSESAEFLAAGPELEAAERIASIMIFDEQPRFRPHPLTRMSCLFGIAKDKAVWDNYETGFYFFPVVNLRAEDRQFVRDFTGANIYQRSYAADGFDERLILLDSLLETGHERIDTLLVWGRDERVESVLQKWFEPGPYFEKGRVRLFRRRSQSLQPSTSANVIGDVGK